MTKIYHSSIWLWTQLWHLIVQLVCSIYLLVLFSEVLSCQDISRLLLWKMSSWSGETFQNESEQYKPGIFFCCSLKQPDILDKHAKPHPSFPKFVAELRAWKKSVSMAERSSTFLNYFCCMRNHALCILGHVTFLLAGSFAILQPGSCLPLI